MDAGGRGEIDRAITINRKKQSEEAMDQARGKFVLGCLPPPPPSHAWLGA